MIIDYKKMIEENREKEIQRKEHEAELHRESVRERDLFETQKEIEYFKKQHARKRTTPVRISILSTFIPAINRDKHYLRFFVDGKLEKGFHVIPEVIGNLTKGVLAEKLGSQFLYLIYDNQKN